MSDKEGYVTIHGKSYQTVGSRVNDFRTNVETRQYCIETELIHRDDNYVVMRAAISDEKGRLIASGYAEEQRNATTINKTSALEVAETSAIGRALANFGMAGTEYASADEVAQAIGQRQTPQPPRKPAKPEEAVEMTGKATPTQKARITALLRARGVSDEDMMGVLIEEYGVDPATMTKADANLVIEEML